MSPKPFFQRLAERVEAIDSLLCVGLDPHPQDLPTGATAADARDWCLAIVEQTLPYAAAFKPNAAFFEVFGASGIGALRDLIAGVPSDVPVILDVKRGDIASTARAQAVACFDTLGADAVTLNPYLGRDAVEPFASVPNKGVFVLCRTSNPSSADVQNQILRDTDLPLYLAVGKLASQMSCQDNVGLVVAATHAAEMADLRRYLPDPWFLAPGVGAQGGNLAQTVQAGIRADGLGLLVSVSRGLSRADDRAAAASKLVQAIREAKLTRSSTLPLSPLASGLIDRRCVRLGSFRLRSGVDSPIYVDLRQLMGYPDLLSHAARAFGRVVRSLPCDRLAGVPTAALPLATAVSLQRGWPMIFPRKQVKEYGTRSAIEGPWQAGERAIVLDDVATSGGSILDAVHALREAGLVVQDAVVLIDRQAGATSALAQEGVRLHSVFTLTDLVDQWRAAGRIASSQVDEIRTFLESTA